MPYIKLKSFATLGANFEIKLNLRTKSIEYLILDKCLVPQLSGLSVIQVRSFKLTKFY